MGFIDKLNKLIGLYIATFWAILKIKIWTPFFLFFILQLALLIILRNYVHPYIYPILKAPISLFGESRAEIFSHYPGLYLLLPYIFQMGRIGFGIIFEGLAIGLTSIMFLKVYYPLKYADWKSFIAYGQWPQLAASWTLITAVLFVCNYFIPQLFHEYLIGSPRRVMVFDIAIRLATVLIYTPMIFIIPSMIVYRENILKAFRTSFSIFFKYPIFSFFLALTASFMSIFAAWMTSKADVVVNSFSPELVFYLLLISLIIDLISNVIFTGVRVRFLLDEKE